MVESKKSARDAALNKELMTCLVGFCVSGASDEELKKLRDQLFELNAAGPKAGLSSSMEMTLNLMSEPELCSRLSSFLASDIAKMPQTLRESWVEILGCEESEDADSKLVRRQVRSKLAYEMAKEEASQIAMSLKSAQAIKRAAL